VRLRAELHRTPALAEKVRQVCRAHMGNPAAQRHHFWMHYVEERFA
jgi:hypothetical protein